MNTAYFLNLAVNGIVEGLLVGMLALGITLTFGVAKFPNASAGDLGMFGAYAGWIFQSLTASLAVFSLLVAGISAIVVSALLAVFFWWFVFKGLSKRPGVYSLIASIGVAFMLRSVITLFLGHDQQTYTAPLYRAFLVGPIRVIPMDLWIAAIAVIAMLCVFYILQRTSIGRRMRAIADNPQLAQASGIPAVRTMAVLWLISGGLAGLSGFLLGLKSVISPEMGWDFLLPAFAATILGTVGNPLGAVIGGILVGMAQELSTPFVGFTYKIAIGYVVMLLILLIRPGGIFSSRTRIR